MSNDTSYAFFVGIDWSDAKHDVTIIDDQGHSRHCVIEHSTATIDVWISELLKKADGRPVAIMLEQAKGSLIHALMLRDNVFLYPINPKQFVNYRNSFQTTSAKSDKSDSMLMARMLFERHRQLKPWKPDDELTRLLNRLCVTRRHWVEQRTKAVQRLLDLVKSYFPALLVLAANRLNECPVLLEILKKWPDPRDLKRVHPKQLIRLFESQGYKNPEQRDKLIQAIKAAPLHTQDSTLLTVSAMDATALTKQILNCQDIIDQLEQEIKVAMNTHPDASLFSSLRGAGPALAPRLLTAFGSDRERFEDASQVANFSGIAPVTKQSGKTRLVVRRRACSKYLLQTFHEFASSAAKWSPWSKAYYRLQQSKGMQRHAILRKLAYKWIRILFRVWKTRTPFDEARYVASLSQKCPEILEFFKQQKTTKINPQTP